jgi:hypothetical protein
MPGRAEIGPYHKKLASEMEAILGEAATFYTPDGEKWYKRGDDSEVEFELVPVDPMRSEPAKRTRREGSQVHRVRVFPLSAPSSSHLGTFWVSWHETWWKQNPANYVLVSAGWTLFEGLAGNQDKRQVLRADWEQLPQRRSRRAGHPHWHFDHELFIADEPEKAETAPGLVQVVRDSISPTTIPISVGSIHLAMGAWNKDAGHPQCWQRDYEDDCQQLHDWCVKTLRYLKEQVAGT